MEITYDNSSDNVRNPNTPPRRVTYGQQTADDDGINQQSGEISGKMLVHAIEKIERGFEIPVGDKACQELFDRSTFEKKIPAHNGNEHKHREQGQHVKHDVRETF